MTLSRTMAAWVAAGVVVALAGFLAGRALHKEDAAAAAFDFDAPVYVTAKDAAGLSKAGFSGFGESDGPDGRTVVSGKVVSVSGDTVTLESPSGARSTVRIASATNLRRLEAASRNELRVGQSLLLRMDGDKASGVLIVSERR